MPVKKQFTDDELRGRKNKRQREYYQENRESADQYHVEYVKKKYKQVLLTVNRETDADVLQKLESVPNMRQYLLALIRADIEANGIR